MGDGTEQNPYTRKDVLRRIRKNGGIAKGLDLSRKVFKEGIDLRGFRLQGLILNSAVLEKCHLEGVMRTNAHLKGAFLEDTHLEDARMSGAHLEYANLVGAHLEKAKLTADHLEGAEFFDAHLEEANLINVFLDRTRLSGAHLQGAYMQGAKFTVYTEMASVNWGNYILGEEKEGEKKGQGHFLKWAEEIYRRLKMWYTNAGVYDIAGEFFFREMETKRKQIKWRPNPRHRAWVEFVSLICGYGERPFRVIGWAASVILALALIYFAIGSVWGWGAFWSSLYFSAVSFTALGYGSWMELPDNLKGDFIRAIGAVESFIGVFSIALFLITFTRKMRR